MKNLSCISVFFCIFFLSFPAFCNTIQVIDTLPKRRAEVKRIVEFHLSHFGIQNQKIVIFMSPNMPANYKAYLVAAFRDELGVLGFTQINVDNKLKGYCLAKVIGHEIYHIKQMIDKKLYFEDNGSIVKWKGKRFRNVGLIPYEKRPWERECFQKELLFAYAYLKYKRQILSHSDLGGQEKNDLVSTEGKKYPTLPVQLPLSLNYSRSGIGRGILYSPDAGTLER